MVQTKVNKHEVQRSRLVGLEYDGKGWAVVYEEREDGNADYKLYGERTADDNVESRAVITVRIGAWAFIFVVAYIYVVSKMWSAGVDYPFALGGVFMFFFVESLALAFPVLLAAIHVMMPVHSAPLRTHPTVSAFPM